MKRHLVLAFAALLTFAPLPIPHLRAEDAPPQKAELDLLQGSWEGTEVGHESDGKCTITISGSAISFQGWNQGEWYKGTIELPANTSPKELLATIKECPFEAVIGKAARAIYKIENGTLTLVGHPPAAPEAPKTFDGDSTSRTFIFKKANS